MTVKLRGQDGNSRIKTMASVKIKAAAPPSDAAPPSRRKSLIADKPSAPAGTPPKRDDSVKVRAVLPVDVLIVLTAVPIRARAGSSYSPLPLARRVPVDPGSSCARCRGL